MQPARSPVQTRSRVAATQEPLWGLPEGAGHGGGLQYTQEPLVEAVEAAPVGVFWRGTSFSQAVGVAGGGFFSWDEPEEMEGPGERARSSSRVKFNGKNTTMRVSKLRQVTNGKSVSIVGAEATTQRPSPRRRSTSCS
jgi:hypothetical protein